MLWALVDLFLMERLFSQETIFFFTDYFTMDKNGFVHYRIQAFLSKKTISELVYFAEYSNTRQDISKYHASYRKLFVNDKKEKRRFL